MFPRVSGIAYDEQFETPPTGITRDFLGGIGTDLHTSQLTHKIQDLSSSFIEGGGSSSTPDGGLSTNYA
jgi:hypothetical protein